MPKIEQHDYLSPEAKRLRQRDGTPPCGVHLCELDSLANVEPDNTAFGAALVEARRLRDEIEAQP